MKRISGFLLLSLFILSLVACGKPIDRTITFHKKNGLDYIIHAKQEGNKLVFEGTIQNKLKKNLKLLYSDTSTIRIKTKNGVTPDGFFYRGAHKITLKQDEKLKTNTVTIPYDKNIKSVNVIVGIVIDHKLHETTHKMTLQDQ